VALARASRYNRAMLARPVAFVLGLLLCLAGAITCATAPADDRQAFPSRADKLVIGGLAMVVLGVAGREARGRQLLGRRRRSASPSAPSAASAPPTNDAQ
jgi:peptidoglycan/LPS O-acetylase OafA/YrhL